jgi:CelD/BcsL family acetyltransferase involved in cellulose biosynthesis
MNVRRLGLGTAVDERRVLAEATGNVFATPEFHETWWRHFGRGEPQLHGVFDGERLAGVLPLYHWRPGVARFIGHGGGDELGPVALDADRADIARMVARVAALVVCEHLRPEWNDALGASVVLSEASPVLPVSDHAGWDDYLATRSSNFRGQVRSRTRKLEQAHDVRYRLADESTLDDDLDTLFRLHRARWQRPSTFGSREAFHRDFARVALANGWARLVLLEVDDRPAAAWYGFRFGDVDSYYQSGRDPGFERESVGLVLLAHTIRAAFDDGRSEYRFLRGDEPYKGRFTDDESYVVSSVAGRFAPPAAAALRLTRAAARRLRRSRRTARRPDGVRQSA